MTSCAWTEPEMARLKELVEKEMSASQIAAALCREFGSGRTRNSVIGKIKRGNGRWGRLAREGRAPNRRPLRPAVPARSRPVAVSAQSPSPVPVPAPPPQPVDGPVVPVDPPAPLPATAPMRFIDAVFADRCLHFVGDPLGPDGPDMPVCGAERAQHAHRDNRYCSLHIASGREAVPA